MLGTTNHGKLKTKKKTSIRLSKPLAADAR